MTDPQDPKNAYEAAPPYNQYGAAPQAPSTEQYSSGQYTAPQQYSAAPTYAAPQYGPPKSNAGWAVASIIFFWPVAFAAFNHLHDIYPKWAMGDHQGAQYASDRVKKLGQISLGIFLAGWVLLIIFYIIIIAAAVSSVNSTYN
ncbi:CD225/dispanin family protein [Rhodococcus sp. IEGM 1379]|uniref:CD225/dispanin family protein n=1 Tax=Rhodococcus sp. IEGM 1379 TaxID=3047086 RepID=UPI0024B6EA0B|nr:CD225/dispanin family protein [Rhodococcus sp. IEGM 1379]MDI9918572.1 CD225/dispanin family protein [Rhodococcus sp. IEGM 1379]